MGFIWSAFNHPRLRQLISCSSKCLLNCVQTDQKLKGILPPKPSQVPQDFISLQNNTQLNKDDNEAITHYARGNSIYTLPVQEATGLTAFHISKIKKKEKIAFMEQLQIKNISHIRQKVSSYFMGGFFYCVTIFSSLCWHLC